MKKIGIFFGSSTGDTEFVANELVRHFGADHATAVNVIAAEAGDFDKYDCIILGTSTWRDAGLQYDWEFYIDLLDEVNLEGKKVALYGLGDQVNYPDNFADAVSDLYHKVLGRKGIVVGAWPLEGYHFNASKALEGDHFVGLVVDEINQRDMTAARIAKWAALLDKEFEG